MSDPVFEDVETWCSKKRSRPVVLSLRVESAPKGRSSRVVAGSKGRLVAGFAASCDCEFGCDNGVHCLLGKRIITGRKRK